MGKTITFTGHRPNKLYGYNLKHPKYLELNKLLESMLEEKIKDGYDTFITGGALGFDTVAFLSVKNLKKKYPHIKNIMAIPFKNQYIKWNEYDRRLYATMKTIADEIVYVDTLDYYKRTNTVEGEFHSNKLKIRNEYMIDNSDFLIALWDGDYKSGTGHCVNYAKKKLSQDIIVIEPQTLEISTIMIKNNKKRMAYN